MKLRAGLFVGLITIVFGSLYFVQNKTESGAVTERVATSQSPFDANRSSSPSELSSPTPVFDTQEPDKELVRTYPTVPEAIIFEDQSNSDNVLLASITALMDDATQSLHSEAGLSKHNLMVLNELAIRVFDFSQSHAQTLPWHELKSDWPENLMDALHSMVLAQEAEMELFISRQEEIRKNPEGYRSALLDQQKQILGSELFKKLYEEDSIVISNEGLSGSYSSTEEKLDINSNAHQDRLKLLEKWQSKQLTEVALREALSESLSSQEINQLVDMNHLHENWLEQLGGFLSEYRYIEQSGIAGEDEALARKELIERHFGAENGFVVDQFLFRELARL